MKITTHMLVPGIGPVELSLTDTSADASADANAGKGRPVLVLHGGGGPQTVAAWASLLAERHPTRVLVPTHPGFDGTPRPTGLRSIRDLAATYAELIATLDLDDVTVVGNSIGGWIAAEMAASPAPRVGRYVLVDAVGIDVPGHPVVDIFGLTPAELADLSYHDPATYGIDPTTLPPAARARMAGNRETLADYAGSMTDPTLSARLHRIASPTLVVWGEADRISDAELGRAYAAAIPGARFRMLERTGHLPQIESPEALLDAVWDFVEHGS
jgi:pimeloyl-ACP methyl ester carboxylesterase